jgi:hypothetical protein
VKEVNIRQEPAIIPYEYCMKSRRGDGLCESMGAPVSSLPTNLSVYRSTSTEYMYLFPVKPWIGDPTMNDRHYRPQMRVARLMESQHQQPAKALMPIMCHRTDGRILTICM